MARRLRAAYTSCNVTVASAGVSRTADTKRAAMSEWPPSSVKKSASKPMAWPGKTRLAAACSAASVMVRGVSSTSASAAVSPARRSALRSTLPEVSRGSVSTSSKCDGIM